nr:MAG TPA: hypothetical protein [Caudoviricetes sp.]
MIDSEVAQSDTVCRTRLKSFLNLEGLYGSEIAITRSDNL